VHGLASSLPQDHPLNALAVSRRRCHAGERWAWDGVDFAFLHPRPGEAGVRRNNLSCVLRIATAGGAMLLTGDIERAAEISLIKSSLRADVLLVPHHGSRTSSTREFIQAVSPRCAVLPNGYRNRFGHPHPEVLERYRAAGAGILRTDLDGAVHVVLKGQEITVAAERARRPRYWRGRPPV
jgi:competence protein ComEC